MYIAFELHLSQWLSFEAKGWCRYLCRIAKSTSTCLTWVLDFVLQSCLYAKSLRTNSFPLSCWEMVLFACGFVPKEGIFEILKRTLDKAS